MPDSWDPALLVNDEPFDYVSQALQTPPTFWETYNALEETRYDLLYEQHTHLKSLSPPFPEDSGAPKLLRIDGTEEYSSHSTAIGNTGQYIGSDRPDGKFVAVRDKLTAYRKALEERSALFKDSTPEDIVTRLVQSRSVPSGRDGEPRREEVLTALRGFEQTSKELLTNLKSIEELFDGCRGLVYPLEERVVPSATTHRSGGLQEQEGAPLWDQHAQIGRPSDFWSKQEQLTHRTILVVRELKEAANVLAMYNDTQSWCSAIADTLNVAGYRATPVLDADLTSSGGRYRVDRSAFERIRAETSGLPWKLGVTSVESMRSGRGSGPASLDSREQALFRVRGAGWDLSKVFDEWYELLTSCGAFTDS